MRVVYDGHIFRWQKAGGIRRYFTEIITHLPPDWTPIILGSNGDARLPSHGRLKVSMVSSTKPRRFTQPIKTAWWKLVYARDAAVLHPTYYQLNGGLRLSDFKCPKVITVHDFIGATYPQLEDFAASTVRAQRDAIRQADLIICVSKYTEQDLLNRYPEASGRTTVIYHGSGFPVCDEPPPEGIFEQPKFLFVGRRGTYKNFLFLLRAFALARKSRRDLKLVVAGPPLTMEEKWQMHFLGVLEHVSSFAYPDEAALRDLYRGCVALVYPSRHEGFGIPPLEAMACGTLAITSNATSLPEVVGGAGILLSPTDEKEWADCLIEVATGRGRRSELLRNGRERARSMTWDKSARRHVEMYRMLC
jgi:glycosyltransferase involved in cell wall biosynthesis